MHNAVAALVLKYLIEAVQLRQRPLQLQNPTVSSTTI